MAVTEVTFGGAAIGNLFTAVSDSAARAAVDAAWDGGIRTFDTAPHYGLGLSERRLGLALRDRPRDSYVISTKVGRLLSPAGRGAAARAAVFGETAARTYGISAAGIGGSWRWPGPLAAARGA